MKLLDNLVTFIMISKGWKEPKSVSKNYLLATRNRKRIAILVLKSLSRTRKIAHSMFWSLMSLELQILKTVTRKVAVSQRKGLSESYPINGYRIIRKVLRVRIRAQNNIRKNIIVRIMISRCLRKGIGWRTRQVSWTKGNVRCQTTAKWTYP